MNLSLLQPELIVPDLLDKLAQASTSLTEPHRFHVCIQVSPAYINLNAAYINLNAALYIYLLP